MKENMLPFVKPPVVAYQVYAYPLGALFTEESSFEWFCSDFIQLKCLSNFIEMNDLWFEYHAGNVFWGIPIVNYHVFTKNDITNVLEFISDRIDEGKYTYTFVDNYYIPQSPDYMKTHFIHDILVYGYSGKEFHIAGFKNNSFSTFTISFDEFINAFSVTPHFYMPYFKTVICFKKKQDNPVNFAGYIDKTARALSDYLYSYNPSYRCGLYNVFETHTFNSLEAYKCLEELYNETIFKIQKDRVYGLETNKCLKEYLINLVRNYVRYDMRPFHVFYEHKKIMAIKLKYLENRFGLESLKTHSSKYEELGNTALEARNLMLKYTGGTKQVSIVKNIIGKIDEIEFEERAVIPELIDILTDLHNDTFYINKMQKK